MTIILNLAQATSAVDYETLLTFPGFWPLLLASLVVSLLMLIPLLRWWVARRNRNVLHREGSRHSRLKGGAALPGSLRRLSQKHYTIFSDIRLSGPAHGTTIHLDYVVVSTHGIFVIKTKTDPGAVMGGVDDQKWTQTSFWRRTTFRNPLWAVSAQVTALAQCLDLPEPFFHPVVFFTRGGALRTPLPANVLNSGLGRYIVKHRKNVLSPEMHAQVLRMMKLLLAAADAPEFAQNVRRNGAGADGPAPSVA